eukprot:10109559-Lingulodinium_polyedra.AAC.1
MDCRRRVVFERRLPSQRPAFARVVLGRRRERQPRGNEHRARGRSLHASGRPGQAFSDAVHRTLC